MATRECYLAGVTQEWSFYDIRALRVRMGMTQAAFADLLDVSRSTVSRWETGAHPPTSRHRIALSTVDRMHRSVFTSALLPTPDGPHQPI